MRDAKPKTHCVQRPLQKGQWCFSQQRLHRSIHREDVPTEVDRHGGVRLVALENGSDNFVHQLESGGLKRPLRIELRISAGMEQDVSLSKRQLEFFGEPDDHVAAGCGSAGFEKAQVPGRDLRVIGEGQLTEPAVFSPLTQQLAELTRTAHKGSAYDREKSESHYLPGN